MGMNGESWQLQGGERATRVASSVLYISKLKVRQIK